MSETSASIARLDEWVKGDSRNPPSKREVFVLLDAVLTEKAQREMDGLEHRRALAAAEERERVAEGRVRVLTESLAEVRRVLASAVGSMSGTRATIHRTRATQLLEAVNAALVAAAPPSEAGEAKEG